MEFFGYFRKKKNLCKSKLQKKLLNYSRYRRFGFPSMVKNKVEKLWRFSPIKIGKKSIQNIHLEACISFSVQNLFFCNPETNLSAVAADDKQASKS